MRFSTSRLFCFSLTLLIALPAAALAGTPAITCHCFTDRSYNPVNPTLADPYFLATTQNSFFATAFAVDKKTIVIKKQKGASAADLWIAYWLAARSAANPEELLTARKAKGSWRQAVNALGLTSRIAGSKFSEALNANATDARLADLVVDEQLLRFRLYNKADLTGLRKAGAGNQELILAAVIGGKTKQQPLQLYLDVKNGSRSWGGFLDRAQINPAEIQKEITALVSRAS